MIRDDEGLTHIGVFLYIVCCIALFGGIAGLVVTHVNAVALLEERRLSWIMLHPEESEKLRGMIGTSRLNEYVDAHLAIEESQKIINKEQP